MTNSDLSTIIAELSVQDPDSCPDPMSREWVIVSRKIAELSHERERLLAQPRPDKARIAAVTAEVQQALARLDQLTISSALSEGGTKQ